MVLAAAVFCQEQYFFKSIFVLRHYQKNCISTILRGSRPLPLPRSQDIWMAPNYYLKYCTCNAMLNKFGHSDKLILPECNITIIWIANVLNFGIDIVLLIIVIYAGIEVKLDILR